MLDNNENMKENRKNIFLNTNKLPKIINRLSLSNFHKKMNNNDVAGGEVTKNKFSILKY